MTIATYAELKTAIVNWYKDRSDLTTYADELIDLAEGYFNAELRVREMEKTTDLTPTAGVCTLPADFLEIIQVVELSSFRRSLEYITKRVADDYYPTRTAGLSCHYMVVGSSLTALPISANDIELTYYQKIPALSNSTTTNWLLTKMPNIYLHACLMYAAEFLKEDDQIAKEAEFVGRFQDQLAALDMRSRQSSAGMYLTGVFP
jgi:hypothetical protein